MKTHSFLAIIALATFAHSLQATEPSIDFRTQIAPIFEQHCVTCHSPNIKKGDLSLATIDDLNTNEFVVAGDPDASYLIELVTSIDGEPAAMPQKADPLSLEQVDSLRAWIIEGANWPANIVVKEKAKADATWWSLQPVPTGSPHHDNIDDFIREKLDTQNLQRNPPANRRTLIRRATYDLIGLPPTPEEVQAFVGDDDTLAYEKLIDRLLQSPHYGERWGRHWLDVVRFGESIGYERNVIVNDIWPFRDYVIRSINEDKPFDQFIREHIAGDVFGEGNPDIAVGTAFLVAGPYDDVGNQDQAQAAQIRANTLDEIISATGEAFLGMTLGCSRCHDHKFDPILQRDYYGLYATFAGIRHGSVELATPDARSEREQKLKPLNERKSSLQKQQKTLRASILQRARERITEHESSWTRPAVDRTGTEERFEATTARFVRLVCDAQDKNAKTGGGFGIDEFEVWSVTDPKNVALAINGGTATGQARKIEDFPNAYGPQLAIDGKTGARFIAAGSDLTIKLNEPTLIDRVLFSSAKNELNPEHAKFAFVAEYRIEVSVDGETWREVASGRDRKPVNLDAHLDRRLMLLETTGEENAKEKQLAIDLADVARQIAGVPNLPSVWIGKRVAEDAKGPFHVFLGGSAQKKGEEVTPASLAVLRTSGGASYELATDTPESQRRMALADWIVDPKNPLTPRVLANRIWHYHFGNGIVDTPSDFGYMGGRPTHPALLDFLATKLKESNWRLKPMHRMIMLSNTYQQSSDFLPQAASVDSDSRLLWRFPPRRLSAEEVRDTMLWVSGKLEDKLDSGPGFRLYHFMQDNVCTYAPLDQHAPETYRRAIYHQNARASVVDLMTEFDQPDCTFGVPKRAETTTPLQSLTMLNHSFTLDMAHALAERLKRDTVDDPNEQIDRAYQLLYSRRPTTVEIDTCREFLKTNSLIALCRVWLNTSEMIYVR